MYIHRYRRRSAERQWYCIVVLYNLQRAALIYASIFLDNTIVMQKTGGPVFLQNEVSFLRGCSLDCQSKKDKIYKVDFTAHNNSFVCVCFCMPICTFKPGIQYAIVKLFSFAWGSRARVGLEVGTLENI